MIRRVLLCLLLCWPWPALAADGLWRTLQEPGAIVLFRHANAPGTGDPPAFDLDNCATQRNLDGRGRAEAKAIGAAFRRHGIEAGMVLTSQWCRTRDTAELAFPGRVSEQPAFNSFFGNRAAEPAQTAAARAILRRWQGPGVLVVVTHQVNIAALTGIAPRPGEGIILRSENGALRVVGRLPPPELAP
ncbi:MAG: histidine phosphatase family protein [Aestuariivirga sp.]|uniref:histidine phosphatase family protein n=1 Tax=Aestuariivirga sp. TaxID=2650926 RepID=UPI0038D1A824